MLLQQLEAWGMKVDAFATRDEAFRAIREAAASSNPYRIAIIDDHIEGTDGAELVRDIKDDSALEQTSVIMLRPFSDSHEQWQEQLPENVVDKYVDKPLFGSALFNAIMAVLTGIDDAPVDTVMSRQRDGWLCEWEENQSYKKILENFSGDPSFSDPSDPSVPDEETEGVILVAEDNRVNQIVVGEILAQAGFRFEIVGNGRLACDAVAERRFDLILMDCQMPEMDGFEAVVISKENEAVLGIPVAELGDCFRRDLGMFDFERIKAVLTGSMLQKEYDPVRHVFLVHEEPFRPSIKRIEYLYSQAVR